MAMTSATDRCYADLHEHLARLDQAGLLYRVTEPVNKDTEMHPLVRWQFRGGIDEKDRRAFLFSNIVDAKGHRYEIPMVIGAFAANPEIYRIGMNVGSLDDIGPAWARAIAQPIAPRLIDDACCHEIILTGDALHSPGQGLESLPIPISTPGFDAAPFLTATCVITRDPDSGVQNMGTYRAQLKSPDRLGLMMFTGMRQGGLEHWKKYQARHEKMPVAIVVGCPPVVAFVGPQKLPIGVDELGVAGGLAGGPINIARARTVDLHVPAEAELVVEGYIDTEYLEPEGPFGESHGYIALEEYNFRIDVTAITSRKNALLTSMISQVTPSESSVVKRLAYEPMYLSYLRDQLSIKGIVRVAMHEPLTNLRRVVALQVARGTPRTEIWRALTGTLALQSAVGKFVIAVDEDIDPANPDSVWWAMSYRCNPVEDVQIVPYRERGHGPRGAAKTLDSAMLIDATMKYPMPPIALPKREYMENAKALWERLGLPELRPQAPWHGYSLGDWEGDWDKNAIAATRGEWMNRNDSYRSRQRNDVVPNSSSRPKNKN
jgi:4-hydroxy-3-polyprenylbenzoate decarboxylase